MMFLSYRHRDRVKFLSFTAILLTTVISYLLLRIIFSRLSSSLFSRSESDQQDEIIIYVDESDIIRSYKLHPPPPDETDYKLDNSKEISAQNLGMITFVRKFLQEKGVEKGFFIESGAHDGEYLSNTLALERDFGWRGLLVEPDPVAFDQLLTKGRKSWAANVCLSTTQSEMNVKFHVNTKFRVLGRIQNDNALVQWKPELTQEHSVKCVPLAHLLSAINVSTVDYFSLDIEGSELDVLKTIPFDKIFIKVLTVENNLIPGGRGVLHSFMKSNNYKLVNPRKYMDVKTLRREGAIDSVFVHNRLISKES